MYITPNSNVILIHNYPGASDHQHTYLFATAAQQYNYFRALAKYSLAEYSYQRAGLGRIRVGLLADNLYDVNYMMFQNTSYGNRWFYCFVTKITYINDGCSELEYVIDPLQTWRFDWEIRQSFIERQHSVTDAIGDSITPENVQTGELVYNTAFQSVYSGIPDNYNCLIIGVIDNASQPVSMYRYDNAFSGAILYAFDMSGAAGSASLNLQLGAAKDLLSHYVSAGQPDAVAFMYMCPIMALPAGYTISTSATWSDHIVDTSVTPVEIYTYVAGVTGSETLNGYTPKNKKLYTYPYNMLIVTNGCGASVTLRYELFDNPATPQMAVASAFTLPVSQTLRPAQYKGQGNPDRMLSIALSGWPSCSWSNDAYQAYIAQQSHSNLLWKASEYSVAGSLAEMNIPYVSEAAKKITPILGALGSSNINLMNPLSIISGLQGLYAASNQVDQARGSTQNIGPLYAVDDLGFKYTRASVQAAKAKQIDDFFTRFGYAVNELGTPNLAARPAFTYVKTNAAFVCGGFDDATGAEISAILDNGVTFWQPGTTMADYSVNNAPV